MGRQAGVQLATDAFPLPLVLVETLVERSGQAEAVRTWGDSRQRRGISVEA